jgi:hypothetical protein
MLGASFSLSSLPPQNIFPPETPCFPNLWFSIDTAMALRGEYTYAVRFLIKTLEERLELKDTFIRDIENHNLVHLLSRPGEGSDFQARIGPLQHYEDPEDPSRSHWHQVHARFFISPLIEARRYTENVTLKGRPRDCFLVPASVHYEVATEDPLHPYVDSCPLCGITGEYNVAIDQKNRDRDYCLKIHDPLGLELLLYGRIRGKRVCRNDGAPLPCIQDLESSYSCTIEEFKQRTAEHLVLSKVYLGPKAT